MILSSLTDELCPPTVHDQHSPPRPPGGGSTTFGSLRTRNFRLFVVGQLFSNTGGWMQRIAQDWLVLTLTGSATAVGITTALQFASTMLLGLYGGLIADRWPKRRILLVTQVCAAALAALLAALVLTGSVRVWHVYVIAFVLGTVFALDNPARQSFVNEMVGPQRLHNAISLNSSVFQLGALIGPAVSGLLINAAGVGWSFALNAVSYVAPVTALLRMRPRELHVTPHAAKTEGRLRAGLQFAAGHRNVRMPILLVGMIGLFTINLPVALAAYAKTVFDSGAGGYGLLSSLVAVGSVGGALISARRRSMSLLSLVMLAGAVALLELLTAAAPSQLLCCAALVPLGTVMLLFVTSANSIVQTAAPDALRGRVISIYLTVFIGSGAFGGPLVGYLSEHLGPRQALGTAGIVSMAAAAALAARLARGAAVDPARALALLRRARTA
jgi:MFS family permease